jgi:hypothetical protein
MHIAHFDNTHPIITLEIHLKRLAHNIKDVTEKGLFAHPPLHSHLSRIKNLLETMKNVYTQILSTV